MTATQTKAQPVATLHFSMPSLFLRIEGAAVFAACIAGYVYIGASGWLFLILLLAPDLAMLGYLRNPQVGAVIYNLAHLALWPLLLILGGLFTGTVLATTIGLIWLAHIGMDRIVGYGFKYSTAFKDTHMDRV